MGQGLFDEIEEFISAESDIDDILGYSLRDLCLRDRLGQLKDTQYTQPALFAVNALHYYKTLKDGAHPHTLLGHSLGEYNALLAAGAFDLTTGIRIVKKRGELMSSRGGGMSAVIGLDAMQISSLLSEERFSGIDIANYNSPSQVVISGPAAELALARPLLEARGAQMVIPLAVSAAFHSRHMAAAAKSFDDFLKNFTFNELRLPVISNVTGLPYPEGATSHSIRDLLVKQIASSVRWTQSIRLLLEQGATEFRELGPGNVLTGLVRQIQSAIPNRSQVAPATSLGYSPRLSEERKKRRTVFLFSGQGSQYFQMGAPLFESGGKFAQSMKKMDVIVKDLTGLSVIDTLYKGRSKSDIFNDILLTSPAIFMVEFALAHTLIDGGIEPDMTLGVSLGSVAASVIAGSICFEDALIFILRKASTIRRLCGEGGMISILASPKIFESDVLRDHCVIAGYNFPNNFVVSAPKSQLKTIEEFLMAEGHAYQRLPLDYPFHSPWMDSTKDAILELHHSIKVSAPRIPLVCCASGEKIDSLPSDYFWSVTRKPILFDKTISRLEEEGTYDYIDAGPSGSLATSLKYLLPKSTASGAFPVMNPFGHDLKNLAKLRVDLCRA